MAMLPATYRMLILYFELLIFKLNDLRMFVNFKITPCKNYFYTYAKATPAIILTILSIWSTVKKHLKVTHFTISFSSQHKKVKI